jgi:hypothetical protein
MVRDCVLNYLHWPLYLGLTAAAEADFASRGVCIRHGAAPAGIKSDVFIQGDDTEGRLLWAEALRLMREELVHVTDARVILGGQLNGYRGRMPGVVEEALLTIEAGKPLYVCGAWGGASAAVAALLLEGKAAGFSEEEQCQDTDYRLFLDRWNRLYPTQAVAYKRIAATFHEKGLAGLSSSNGLTAEENLRLFSTPHPQEMIFLILKGLRNARG